MQEVTFHGIKVNLQPERFIIPIEIREIPFQFGPGTNKEMSDANIKEILKLSALKPSQISGAATRGVL